MKTFLRILVAFGFVMGLGFMGADGPWWGNFLGLALFGWSCLTMKYIQ